MEDVYRQLPFDVRCAWGLFGVQALAPDSDAVIVVDVLSFSTAVDVALSREATVFPYRWTDETAADFAESHLAVLAGRRGKDRWSLSPMALRELPKGIRIVLPSPNGSTLSIATGEVPTFTGCLRNAKAVAEAASQVGKRISVIPAGELTDPQTITFAIEDLYGAGAILSHLEGSLSPEAKTAVEAFEAAAADGAARMRESTSGRQLIERGFAEDVEIALELDASDFAPRLTNGAYRPA